MVELKGRRFDCGSVPGFVAATNHVYAKKYFPFQVNSCYPAR